ncbi:MAG TPA: hypothetical protein VEH08_05005 [Methanomassiliicoccales archaeon]|nr:hypothetical protein [Methanomassiliicoccales archaeon]
MECAYLDLEGKCRGPYLGFGCIKEKCTADKHAACEHNEKGFYCRKYKRFECIGIGNCGSLDDYINFVNLRRKKSQSSK